MPRPRLGAEPLSNTEKATRHRARQKRIEDALAAIDGAKTLREAKRIAREARAPLPADAPAQSAQEP